MRVAAVVAGRVVNVAEAESLEVLSSPVFVEVFGAGVEFFDVDAVPVGPGWSRDGDDWTEPSSDEGDE